MFVLVSLAHTCTLEGVILALFLKSDMLGLFFWWGWFPDCETTFGIPDGQKENGAISFFTSNFGSKICFFLRYAHVTHFFGLRQTRLNGVISSSYPEVTLDTFGFLVGGRFMAPIAQSVLSWGQKCCFSAPAATSRPAMRRSQHKKVVFFVSRHVGIK